jgi:hypothetical protein
MPLSVVSLRPCSGAHLLRTFGGFRFVAYGRALAAGLIGLPTRQRLPCCNVPDIT